MSILLILIVGIIVYLCLIFRQIPNTVAVIAVVAVVLALLLLGIVTGGLPLPMLPHKP